MDRNFELKRTPEDIRQEVESILGMLQPEEIAEVKRLVAEMKWKQSPWHKWTEAAKGADWAVVPTSSGIYRGPIWR